MKIINVSFDRLERVVHMADIHIRLFKRHNEYRSAFAKLYEDLQKEDLTNTVIVVAGDILHAKLDLSPEMIALTSEFLIGLSELAPTLVIDGNHDLNLANRHRLNSLSPIINNIGHKNLHYLKDSGVYRVADTEFAVFGIADEPEDWPTADQLTSDVKICLFHGPVHGAMTDTKFTITSRSMNISAFSGFDIAMLGDIHKHQVLNESDPAIVYPSSLIQQNHGESIDNHGWVLWDIPSKSFEFKELKNDYGYVTLDLSGNSSNKYHIPDGLPKNIRLRIFTDHVENSVLKKVVTMVKKKYNVLDTSVNPRRISNDVTQVVPGLDIGDLTDVNIQNELITEWLKNHHPFLNDTSLSAVLNVNRFVNEQISYVDHSRNISWKPLEFWFSNLFSYGEENYIDFTNLDGTNGIFAPNATGKSSSMEALIFTLFDKTPRAFRGDHIMNNRKNDFHCKLVFEVNEVQYFIERHGKRKSNGSVKVDVEFWRIIDGVVESLNGESRYDTNANIRTHVGDYEDFILTSLSGQTGNSLFIDKSHSERKALLNQFMGLNIFEHLWTAANDLSREIQGVLKKFAREDFTSKLSGLQTNIESAMEKSLLIQSEIGECNQQIDVKQREIETLSSQKTVVPVSVSDINDLVVQRDNLGMKCFKLEENHGILQSEFTSMVDQLRDLRAELDKMSGDELKKSVDLYDTLEREHHKLAHDAQLNIQVMDSKKAQAKVLSAFRYNPDCDVCVDNNKAKLEQLSLLEGEIDVINYTWEQLNTKIIDLEKELERLTPICVEYKKFQKISREYDGKKLAVDSHRNSIDRYQNQIDTVNSKIREIDAEIELAAQYKDQIASNLSIDKKLSTEKDELRLLKEKCAELDSVKMSVHGELKVLEDRRAEILKELQEITRLEKEFEAYRYYIETVSRDGLPYDIISDIIPAIQLEINNILSQIVPFSISLDVDGKNVDGRIVYDLERSWPLENSSGMERFISSLAIRVALLKASNLPKSNFLIIDEGMGSLDTEYLHGMQLLFDVLKEQFDFLIIISHLDNIRDMVDNIIEIHQSDGYSYINH